MEGELGGEEIPSDSTNFSVNVLEIIKFAQSQHGARYSDYQRYRRYCTSRLRRLYKSLKFLHGKGKYMKKALDVSTVTEVRFLHVPIFLAERAWGYAMDLKTIENAPDLPRKRLHLICRMTKAARWADLLVQLCSEKGDPRTILEAEAYASYMWGNVLLEKENNWEAALEKFRHVSTVYEQLGKVGEVANQVLCRQRVDEMEPNIRYCNYKMGKTDVAGSGIRELAEEADSPGFGILQSKLEAVMEEARAKQALSMTEIVWQGKSYPIHGTKTKLAVLKAQEIETELESMVSNERKLNLFDRLFFTYHEAKRHIRDDLVTAGDAQDVKAALSSLDRAVSCILLEKTVERNLLLVSLAKARLDRQRQGKLTKEDKSEKAAKPEDLARLYDILLQNVADLTDLMMSGREQREEDHEYADLLDVRKGVFQASKCMYVAMSFSNAVKLPEAYCVYVHAADLAKEVQAKASQLATTAEEEASELRVIEKASRAQKCIIHARLNLEEVTRKEEIASKVAEVSLEEKGSEQEDPKYLMDFLDEYKSAAGVLNKPLTSRIAPIPPRFRAVPCRPIVLDTAVNSFVFPSLEGKAKAGKKDAAQGWLGGFFGRR